LFYVYAHTKPDGEIFYVGKGTRKRFLDKRNRNQHWYNVVNKYGYNAIILANNLTENQAIEEEAQIIKHFKKFGKLVNILDRGDINAMSNPEVAKKCAETKRKLGQYTGKEISEYNKKYKDKIKNPEFAKKVSENRKKANLASIKKRHSNMQETVLQIRNLRCSNKTYQEISNITKISVTSVWNIVKGNSYAGVY